MNRRLCSVILMLVVVTMICGCIGRKKRLEATFVVKRISVDTLSVGDTTSIFGSGFGDEQGEVFLGEHEAKVISWSDVIIRIEVPQIPNEAYSVEVQPFETLKKYAGKIALRGKVDERIEAWLDEDFEHVDGAVMEPLIMVFNPVGSPVSGLFDFNAPVSKNREELLDEIEWAYLQGVQVVQLYYPATLTTGADQYADPSMDNVRYIVNEVNKRCQGMIVSLDYSYMPYGNQARARMMPQIRAESLFNLGSFEEENPDTGLGLVSTENAVEMNILLENTTGIYKQPIPYVMTTWQAYNIQNMVLHESKLPENPVFLLSMALDKRAVDDKNQYMTIKKLLPENSRLIAATTIKHVGEIIGYSISQGDHIAFGFHYSQYWPGNSRNYISNNMFVLEKILQVVQKTGRSIATVDQAREMLGLTALPRVETSGVKIFNKISDRPRRIYVGKGRDRKAVLDGLPSNNISAITSDWDSRELWLITGAGVYYSNDSASTFASVNLKLGRKGGSPTDVAITANGAVWISTSASGIVKTADHGKTYNRYNMKSESMNGDIVSCLHSYGNEIYACTFSTDDGNPGTGISYTTDSGANWYIWNKDFGLPSNDVRSIFVEDEWIYVGFGSYMGEGTAAGMAVSSDFGQTWHLVEGIDAPVLSIATWYNNSLIIGTKGAGAFTAMYDGTQPRQISAVPASASVTGITLDPRGWVWLTTDTGVFVSDDSVNFKAFSAVDGLGSDLITGAVYAPPDSMLISTKPSGENPGGLTRIVVSQ